VLEIIAFFGLLAAVGQPVAHVAVILRAGGRWVRRRPC